MAESNPKSKPSIRSRQCMFVLYPESQQDIIDYGTEHPDAPFWDFLKMLKPGLHGITQEELDADE